LVWQKGLDLGGESLEKKVHLIRVIQLIGFDELGDFGPKD
jgi:hypothetical protein